jgi:hypothetical protein
MSRSFSYPSHQLLSVLRDRIFVGESSALVLREASASGARLGRKGDPYPKPIQDKIDERIEAKFKKQQEREEKANPLIDRFIEKTKTNALKKASKVLDFTRPKGSGKTPIPPLPPLPSDVGQSVSIRDKTPNALRHIHLLMLHPRAMYMTETRVVSSVVHRISSSQLHGLEATEARAAASCARSVFNR